MSVPKSERLEQALLQAEHGHRVFPAHHPTETGCSCRSQDCERKNWGKHPSLKGWQREATTDPEQIRQWWAEHPAANIAIATGPGSDLLIVDIDVREGNGFEDLQRIDPAAEGWEGIDTPKAITGSGGGQLYFLWPEGHRLTTGAKLSGTNIDFRGKGGLAIAPGSTNADGPYRWEFDFEDCPKAPAPDWLLDCLTGKNPAKKTASPSGRMVLTVEDDLQSHPGSGEGERNAMLCKLAGAALASGVGPEELLLQALAWNRRCSPPRADSEIERTVLGLIQAELQTLRQEAPAAKQQPRQQKTRLISRIAAEVQEEPLRWLWQNRLLIGHVNILGGNPGVGKSMIAVDAASRVSTGRPWPDGSPCEQGQVMYCTTEDGVADTVKPRLIATDADCQRITFVEGIADNDGEGSLYLDEHCSLLDEALQEQEGRVRLLILDTLQSYLGASISTNNNASSRRALTPLKRLAEKHQVAVLCLEHLTKGGGGAPANAGFRLQGSIAFLGAARAVWFVVKDPDDESRRIVQAAKCNLAPDSEGLGMAYTITGEVGRPRIEWQEFNIATSLSDLMAEDRKPEGGGGGEFQRAVAWLQENLGEPTPATVMDEGARTEGISKATLRRAKDHLGISSRKTADGWQWIPGPSVSIGEVVIADPMKPAPGKVLIPEP